MAYSKLKDIKRWIKKLKYRQSIFESFGDMQQANKLKSRREAEIKKHGL